MVKPKKTTEVFNLKIFFQNVDPQRRRWRGRTCRRTGLVGVSLGASVPCRPVADAVLGVLQLDAGSGAWRSHSLRRGGASMYRMTMDDATVARFGRWESDAYKLYIHIESDAMQAWAKQATGLCPRFELN